MTIFGFVILGAMAFGAWKQIPPEKDEVVAARKRYGKIRVGS